jgi:hypothetical protein
VPQLPQRKVIDSGMLQSPELHRYLSASTSNYAVLPDFVSIEAYKIGSIDRILERWEVLSQFPKQVIVLKGTSKICGLRGRPSGLQRRLIDDKQTAGFGAFCAGLKLARAGDVRYGRELMHLGAAAKEEIDKLSAVVPAVLATRRALVSGYTEGERRAIRAGKTPPESLKAKVVRNVFELAAVVYRGHPSVTSIPSSLEDLSNRYIFRYTLAVHVWLLDWVFDGCMDGSNADRIRNDFVDLHVAAYATYFDGPMTADEKLSRIYEAARDLLIGIRAPAPTV